MLPEEISDIEALYIEQAHRIRHQQKTQHTRPTGDTVCHETDST